MRFGRGLELGLWRKSEAGISPRTVNADRAEHRSARIGRGDLHKRSDNIGLSNNEWDVLARDMGRRGVDAQTRSPGPTAKLMVCIRYAARR
jgi:hypothetical protein